MGLGLMGKGGKSRNLALKGLEEEIDDSEDEEKMKMKAKMKMKMMMMMRMRI